MLSKRWEVKSTTIQSGPNNFDLIITINTSK